MIAAALAVCASATVPDAFGVGARWRAVRKMKRTLSSSEPALGKSLRSKRLRTCSATKGLFIMKRACCGTVVRTLSPVLISGFAKSKVVNISGRLARSIMA